jgi:RHS repeat-associated protein
LPETRVMGLPAGNQTGIGGCWPVTSTLVWGSRYRCDGMASGRLVGLDYADQRFYASTYGRFLTPDPSNSTATAPSDPSNPQSWNRFAYASSDPVNKNDPTGLDDCDPDDPSDCLGDSPYYCPPEYQSCSDGSDPSPGSSSPQSPPAITVPVNVDGLAGSLTITPGSPYATLGFADPADAGAIAAGVCVVIEPCGADVAVIGGAIVAVTVALNQIGALITDIINIIQSRRLYTAVASCSVHQDGTPNHASAGTVTGTGQGVSSGAAVKAAFSAAQANVFAQYGVGFHAQHCSFSVSQ